MLLLYVVVPLLIVGGTLAYWLKISTKWNSALNSIGSKIRDLFGNSTN